MWDTREVVEFPYLDIFKQIVDGCLSGTVGLLSCLETRSELGQRALSCEWRHPRKQVPHAALVTSLPCSAAGLWGSAWGRWGNDSRQGWAGEGTRKPPAPLHRDASLRVTTPTARVTAAVRGSFSMPSDLVLVCTYTCQLGHRIWELSTWKVLHLLIYGWGNCGPENKVEPEVTRTGDSLSPLTAQLGTFFHSLPASAWVSLEIFKYVNYLSIFIAWADWDLCIWYFYFFISFCANLFHPVFFYPLCSMFNCFTCSLLILRAFSIVLTIFNKVAVICVAFESWPWTVGFRRHRLGVPNTCACLRHSSNHSSALPIDSRVNNEWITFDTGVIIQWWITLSFYQGKYGS